MKESQVLTVTLGADVDDEYKFDSDTDNSEE